MAPLLDELERKGWLSDERAAAATVLAKAPRFGARRLEQVLLAKGLRPELVSEALAPSRAGEAERARQVWQRKFGQAPGDDRERARQARFLAGRGFDGAVIRRLMRDVAAESQTTEDIGQG